MRNRALTPLNDFNLRSQVIFGLILLLSHLSVYGQGDTIDCESYQLREFRVLCQDTVSNNDINVVIHDSVSGDLSVFVKSWSENTFHIIPSAVYTVNSTVVLNNVILLPHPLSGEGLGTIKLVASTDFSSSQSPRSLISLTSGARAGGIEIQGKLLPDHLFSSAPGMFLAGLPSSANSLLVGSILTGHPKLDGLLFVSYDDDAYDKDGSGIFIHRNYLKLDGASLGIQVESSYYKPSTANVFNNAILIDSVASGASATAIKNKEGQPDGAINLYQNDLVFVESHSDKPRYGIDIELVSGSYLHGNAFYSLSSKLRNDDIAIFSHKYMTPPARWVVSSGNAFSPNIVSGQSSASESGQSINFIDSGSVQMVKTESYPRMTPQQFFAETGNLGFSPYSVSALLAGNYSTCPSFNQSVLYTDGSDNEQSLMNHMRGADYECDSCKTIYDDPNTSENLIVSAVLVLTLIASPFISFGCYSCCRGRCALPWR